MKKVISTILVLAFVISALCTQAFAAPSYIRSDSVSASGSNWDASLSIRYSQTATATFSSSYKGNVGVSVTGHSYPKYRDGNLNTTYSLKTYGGELVTVSGGYNTISASCQARDGNALTPLLMAVATYTRGASVIRSLKVDMTP